MESDVSVTVLILILSLFHQNIITSSAALTTTSFFVQHAVPSGLATFHAICNFQSQVQQRALRARNYLQHAVPSGLATISFQDPLQLPVPPGLASLQSSRDKLSFFKFSCNFSCPQGSQASRVPKTSFPFPSFPATHRLIIWPKLKMKIPPIHKLPRPMHLKISGFLNPYF